MTILVADVGGTNARLALARDGAIQPATVARFRGEDHARFDDVLRLYLQQQGNPSIRAACVAVAGPVSGGQARLTNRAWAICEQELCQTIGTDRAVLINDMIALGHAVWSDTRAGARHLRTPPQQAPGNGQKLVVNAGTGFNVCAVRQPQGKAATCLEAEEGHAGLPLSVWRLLAKHGVGSARLEDFTTNEDLFCGRGLARLHDALHGALHGSSTGLRAEDVVAAAQAGDAAAERTSALFAEMFGLLCRDLSLRFMPRDGLYLTGSVARSITRHLTPFLDAFDADPKRMAFLPDMPLAMIENDLAALEGCLSVVS